MFRFRSNPVVNTRVVWSRMNRRNQHSTRKCTDLATWMLSILLIPLNLVERAGDIPRPVRSASGAATKIVTK
jgi:hypothetical protein